MVVENSVSPLFTDEDGHAFKVRVLKATSFKSRQSTHRRNQKFKRRTRFQNSDRNIRSAAKIIISPETSVAIPVLANFPAGSNHLYVEKLFSSNRNQDDLYTPPDSLITKGLHIANFSATAVTVQIGQVLGIGHNLNTWLARMGKYSPESQQRIGAHATVIHTLVESQTPDLGLGAQSKVVTVFSKAKDLSNSNK